MQRQKSITGLVWEPKSGFWHIDKQVRGYGRLRESTKEAGRKAAEEYLIRRLLAIRREQEEIAANGGVPRRKFSEAAEQYVARHKHIDSIDETIRQLAVVAPWINDKPLGQVHDGALQPFIEKRQKETVRKRVLLEDGTYATKTVPVTNSTINHTLEVVRRVLNFAHKKLQDDLPNGEARKWLSTAPVVTLLPESQAREPYPLSWQEQEYLFRELPGHLQRMSLFKVNTGTREQEVCQLRWSWEVQVPELESSVFIVPKGFVKNDEDRLIVLNRVARSVVEECRGMHREFVFVYRPNVDRLHQDGSGGRSDQRVPASARAVTRMNNHAWKKGRLRAAKRLAVDSGMPEERVAVFAAVRVHDLKHTFGRRLRAAGVGRETRSVLLGHANGDITTHYSGAELAELIAAAEKVCGVNRSLPTLTVLKQRAA
jgi:integrase